MREFMRWWWEGDVKTCMDDLKNNEDRCTGEKTRLLKKLR